MSTTKEVDLGEFDIKSAIELYLRSEFNLRVVGGVELVVVDGDVVHAHMVAEHAKPEALSTPPKLRSRSI